MRQNHPDQLITLLEQAGMIDEEKIQKYSSP